MAGYGEHSWISDISQARATRPDELFSMMQVYFNQESMVALKGSLKRT